MAKYNTLLPIEFLRRRRSVVAAKITEPGPSKHELDLIIEAGLRVPDHGRCGPWRLQVIDKKGLWSLGDLYAKLFAEESLDATEEQIEYWQKRPTNAPCLIVVTFYPNKEKLEKIPLMEQQLSVGALCQNLLNGAHALGYVAQWLTEWPCYHDQVKEKLGHDKRIDIAGFIFIGSTIEEPHERKRVGAGEVFSSWTG